MTRAAVSTIIHTVSHQYGQQVKPKFAPLVDISFITTLNEENEMKDLLVKHKGKIILTVLAGVMYAVASFLGLDVDISLVFDDDLSALGEALETVE